VNDHRDRRHHSGEPAWPTGADPDAANSSQQEHTGQWRPSWDDDDQQAQRPVRPAGRPAPGPAGSGQGRPRQSPPPSAQPTRALRRPARPGPPAPPGPPGPNSPTVVIPGAKRDSSRDETEIMRPVRSAAVGREPDLITHDPDTGANEPVDDEDRTDDERAARRKKIWRRVRRTTYVVLALMIIGPVLAFFIAYQVVTVPGPDEIIAEQSQVVTLQYADGSELAKITPKNGERTNVKYEDLPPQVLHAVFASEDATFMTNSGFDITGVMRAGWNQVTGGEGGGSTITQQYIKKATGNAEKTLSRKALEVVKAYKMNRTYSKEDIITAYLNTIFFGRNAYGIAAASKAYYAKPDLKSLTPSEAALLAGMIQSPSRYKDTDYQQKRWNYVMDQMVANNWISAQERAAAQFPTPVPFEQTKAKALTDAKGLIQRQALDELANGPLKLTEEQIQTSGYTIVTTIDPKAQELAEKAVADVMKGQPDNLRPALVAIDPKTGQVKAYYGGADGIGTDWASAQQEPGSSFKPFDLVALLKTGKGLNDTFDGKSPRKFPGIPQPIRNSENAQCPDCTVADAMRRSINTVFYDIALKVGTREVAKAAHEAGITSDLGVQEGGEPTAGIAIGGDKTQVSTLEMASAYATFASRGMYRQPYLVAKVLNPDGSPYWEATPQEKPAFEAGDAKKNSQIARNVTESLLPIPKSSGIPCADGRLCAGKTGTHQLGETADNAKAWMVGYTPQLSTAVAMSGTKGEAIKNKQNKIIFGAGLPGQIWQKFMDSYHKTFKLPKEDFGRFEPIGKAAPSNAPKPPASQGQQTPPTRDNNNGGGNGQPETPRTRETRLPDPPGPTFDPPGPGDGGGIVPNR